MVKTVGQSLLGLLILILAGCAATSAVVQILPPATVVQLAQSVTFETVPVMDDPLPVEIRELNPKFKMSVFFRAGSAEVTVPPVVGAIFARLDIEGVPRERDLPDGSYYLWIGGETLDALRAALVKVDGSISREVELRSEPSIPEQAMPHKRAIHPIVEPAPITIPAAGLPPGGIFKPPPPPPRRSWREICVTPAPTNHGKGSGKRWIRVPDN